MNAPMTCEEFFALPEREEVERWLIEGELREQPFNWRSPAHAAAVSGLAFLLGGWLKRQPKPRGRAYCGAYYRLRLGPDSVAFVDVAIASSEVVGRTLPRSDCVAGPPTLAAEVLDWDDQHGLMSERIDALLGAGVGVIWVVDPYFKTVAVHRPGHRPQMITDQQQLPAGPQLPGFQARVADIFAD